MNKTFELVELDDLTPDLECLAETIGIEKMRLVLRHLQGMSFYIPRLARLDTFVERYWRNNRARKSRKQIARDLGVSESYLLKREYLD